MNVPKYKNCKSQARYKRCHQTRINRRINRSRQLFRCQIQTIHVGQGRLYSVNPW